MPSKKLWRNICLSGLTILMGTSLVACGQTSHDTKETTKTSEVKVEKKTEQQVSFKEKPVVIDYAKTPEEILANYTEKGMNAFKVNFPDTLSMNYALKNIGKAAPEITGKTMDGQEVKLSVLKGKKVLISFSKTTCSVCKEMLPVIKEIAEKNADLVILNVFPVDSNKDIETYYKELNQEIPANTLSLETNQHLKDVAVKDYQIEQVPTYVFVDESGKISYTYIGNKDKIMFQDMIGTAFGKEKLYQNVRSVTVRIDKDGNEIKDEQLIDKDGVDHTNTTLESPAPTQESTAPQSAADSSTQK